MSKTDELMTADETAELLRITERALAEMRYAGTGPRFVKVSHKAVRYRALDVNEWIESQVRTQSGAW